jgi:uncharacterized protein involved in exopolysaccharide biosynthesis
MESESQEVGVEAPEAAPRSEGRRTQLRRVSDSLQILSTEVGRFRKSHEVGVKSLESQVASLRKEFVTHIRSKDSGAHAKAHVADTKRLEKQIKSLRSDLASLRAQIAKEAAKSRAREEAALSRIIARAKASKPAKKAQARTSKKKR